MLLNFIVPGIGSVLLNKWRVGLAQFLLWGAAILSFAWGFHPAYAVIGLLAVYPWGLYTAEYSPRTGGVDTKRRA